VLKDKISDLENGWSVSAGQTRAGWFAAALVRPDRDLAFREPMASVWQDKPDRLKEGATVQAWGDGVAGAAPGSIVLLTSSASGAGRKVIADGAGLGSPAVCRQFAPEPLIAWIRRTATGSEVALFAGGEAIVAWQSPCPCGDPDIVHWQGGAVLACQVMGPSGPAVRVWRANDEVLFEAAGRSPHLTVAAGQLHLLYESPHRNGCRLQLVRLGTGSAGKTLPVPPGNDLNFHASLTVNEADGTLLVAHEAAPMWGENEQLGAHRDLYLWMLPADGAEFQHGPDTANGLLPVQPCAFREYRDKNAAPLTPLVRCDAGRLVVGFRRFRQHGIKSFGWDVQLMEHSLRGWTEPVRISENFGTPDTAYDLLPLREAVLLLQPCCDQLPCIRVNENAPAGFMWTEHHEILSYHPGRPYNMRVEVRIWSGDRPLPDVAVLKGMAGKYAIPPSVHDIALEPPVLSAPGRPKFLVWGDLHVHSAYSKCAAAMDGTPEEHLRYQRDHLGCRVFCLTAHTPLMSEPEVGCAFDRLELEAGVDGVPIYGMEPLMTGQDTIYYTRDRGSFERVRVIMQLLHKRPDEYRQIKELLPPRSVLVARHFDGPGDTHPDFSVASFDPDLERLMEAMQVRGDSLMGELDCGNGVKSKDTASKFLNAGKRVGLIGGTDHCEGYGRNHLCLTGFWVDEVTVDAIWDAMWNRRTIAVSKGKIAIWAACGAAGIGEEAQATGSVRIRVWVSAGRTLRRLCLVRDGVPLKWQPLDGQSAEIELVDEEAEPGAHWYSVTVEAASPFHGQSALGHASPMFVTVV